MDFSSRIQCLVPTRMDHLFGSSISRVSALLFNLHRYLCVCMHARACVCVCGGVYTLKETNNKNKSSNLTSSQSSDAGAFEHDVTALPVSLTTTPGKWVCSLNREPDKRGGSGSKKEVGWLRNVNTSQKENSETPGRWRKTNFVLFTSFCLEPP